MAADASDSCGPDVSPQTFWRLNMKGLIGLAARISFNDPSKLAQSATTVYEIGDHLIQKLNGSEEFFCQRSHCGENGPDATPGECLSFTEWISRYLLNLFAQPPPRDLYPQAVISKKEWVFSECSKALTLILRAVGRNDPTSFKVMQENLYTLVTDLMRLRLDGVRSTRMSQAGQRLTLHHLHSFELEKSRKEELGWKSAMKLTTATTEHELENLIRGVLCVLIDSRSFNHIPLDDEMLSLCFRLAHASGVRFVQNSCLMWFTIASDYKSWDSKRVSDFLRQWFSPILDNKQVLRDADGVESFPAAFKSGLSTIFHLLHYTETQEIWRQHLLFWLVLSGWAADQEIRKEIKRYVLAVSVMFKHGKETEKVFFADAAFLTQSMIQLALDGPVCQSATNFHSAIAFFGNCFHAAFQYMVVNAVVSKDAREEALVQEIVKQSGSGMKDLVQTRFSSICAILIRKLELWSDLEAALTSVAKMTGLTMTDLMRARFVARDALFLFNARQANVLKLLERVNRCKVNVSPNKREKENRKFDLKKFLMEHRCLISMLSVANSNIRYGIESNSEELRSLTRLLKQAGGTAVRAAQSQLAPLLNHCVRLLHLKEEEYELIADFYSAYLETVPFDILQENLLLICKDLREQLLPKHRARAIQLLETVICENAENLKGSLREVGFVRNRSDSGFDRLNHVIDQACARFPEEALFEYVAKRTKEIAKTRESMLKILKIGELRNYISRKYELLVTPDRVHPCISKLISTLLKDAKEPDEELSLAIARCLGEIGAIDPARFDVVPASDAYPENRILDHCIEEDNFMVDILTKLAYSTVSFADYNSQWLIMYGLQELMRSLDIQRPRVLKMLPSEVREDCESVTNSQYYVQHDSVWGEVSLIPAGDTVFTFKENKADPPLKYEDWLRIWAKRMIMKLEKSSAAFKVLTGCAPLFAKDYRLTESLLPCIIFNFLKDESIREDEKTQVVFAEMTEVIRSAISHSYSSLRENPHTFDNSTAADSRVTVSAPVLSELQQLSAQQIFVVYDTLQSWNTQIEVPLVEELIKHISTHYLAALAYACRSYARSILYIEKSLREKVMQQSSSSLLELLQKNFIALDEPDGVVGVAATRRDTPSLLDRIIANESTCHLRRALTCCSKGSRSFPDQIVFAKLMIRCFLSLDLTEEAHSCATGLVAKKPEWESAILPFMIQAAWRLSKWPELTDLLKKVPFDEEETCTNVHFGRILSHISTADTDGLMRTLDSVRVLALNPIAAIVSEKGAYVRCYQNLIKLHIITDMQRAALDLCDLKPEPNTRHQKGADFLGKIWKLRNKCILASSHALEPVLNMQRVLFSTYKDQDELAVKLTKSWLASARIARKSCNLPRAENCVLEIEALMEKDVVSSQLKLVSRVLVEVAKCSWAGQEPSSKEEAIRKLTRGMEEHFKDYMPLSSSGKVPTPRKTPKPTPPTCDSSEKKHFARVQLLLTKMLEESQSADNKQLIDGYTEAMNADPDWEKPVFRLARLYDRIAAVTNDTLDRLEYMDKACRHYYMSLQRGCRKIYQSLPRLIDLWCDMGTIQFYYTTARSRKEGQDRSSEIYKTEKAVKSTFNSLTTSVFSTIHKNLPSEYLYTAFSQLLSRVNHSNDWLTTHLREILARIVVRHPKQCMWLLLPAVMSNVETVSHAADEILRSVSDATGGSQNRYIKTLKDVGTSFLMLANDESGKNVRNSLAHYAIGPKIKRLLCGSDILVPHRKFMTVEMPPSGVADEEHKYFADEVSIADIEDEVSIFSSLAHPKKVVLLGSDGKQYPLIVKPKDDMRMDSRVMELIEMVNRLLKKDAESRKRQLHIRSFQIVPLGTAGGLIEFIDGLNDIRSLLLNEYIRANNVNVKTVIESIKKMYPPQDASLSLARSKFNGEIMPSFRPPVFAGWFMNNFSDASVWHLARNEFTRSLAVMSIVGYVIGLGDRHLENILLDTKTGQVIHVDFNLLFNRGNHLKIPEVVPFRLTHNLVDVMGATGYEGHFRRTCEITLQVMRNNREELMSVLKPFVYEPYAGHHAAVPSCHEAAGPLRYDPNVHARRDAIVHMRHDAAVHMRHNAAVYMRHDAAVHVRPNAAVHTRHDSESKVLKKVTALLSRGPATVQEIEKIEIHDEEAEKHLSNIDDRLQGRIKHSAEANPLPLSVAGQVNILIQEAVNVDNLCRLYYGWAPYL